MCVTRTRRESAAFSSVIGSVSLSVSLYIDSGLVLVYLAAQLHVPSYMYN